MPPKRSGRKRKGGGRNGSNAAGQARPRAPSKNKTRAVAAPGASTHGTTRSSRSRAPHLQAPLADPEGLLSRSRGRKRKAYDELTKDNKDIVDAGNSLRELQAQKRRRIMPPNQDTRSNTGENERRSDEELTRDNSDITVTGDPQDDSHKQVEESPSKDQSAPADDPTSEITPPGHLTENDIPPEDPTSAITPPGDPTSNTIPAVESTSDDTPAGPSTSKTNLSEETPKEPEASGDNLPSNASVQSSPSYPSSGGSAKPSVPIEQQRTALGFPPPSDAALSRLQDPAIYGEYLNDITVIRALAAVTEALVPRGIFFSLIDPLAPMFVNIDLRQQRVMSTPDNFTARPGNDILIPHINEESHLEPPHISLRIWRQDPGPPVTSNDRPRWIFQHFDSIRESSHVELGQKIERSSYRVIIGNGGWFRHFHSGREPLPISSNSGPINARRQKTYWECGLYTIFYGWVYALQLELDDSVTLSQDQSSQFLVDGVNIINQAIAGQLSSRTIVRFLQVYHFIRTPGNPGRAATSAEEREFQRTIAFPTYGSYNRYVRYLNLKWVIGQNRAAASYDIRPGNVPTLAQIVQTADMSDLIMSESLVNVVRTWNVLQPNFPLVLPDCYETKNIQAPPQDKPGDESSRGTQPQVQTEAQTDPNKQIETQTTDPADSSPTMQSSHGESLSDIDLFEEDPEGHDYTIESVNQDSFREGGSQGSAIQPPE